jgi:hypothetical protein
VLRQPSSLLKPVLGDRRQYQLIGVRLRKSRYWMGLEVLSRFSSSAILAVLLVVGVSGCATYRIARLPGDAAPGFEDGSQIAPVFVGALARAALKNGEELSGKVTAVTDTSVTFGSAGSHGLVGRTVTISELDVLEMENQSGSPSRTIALLVGMAMALVCLWLALPPFVSS